MQLLNLKYIWSSCFCKRWHKNVCTLYRKDLNFWTFELLLIGKNNTNVSNRNCNFISRSLLDQAHHIHHAHLIFSLFVVLIDFLIRWFDVTESRSYRMVLEVLGQLKILILCFPKVSFILWTLYYRSTEQIYGFVTWVFNVFSKTFYTNSSFWSHQR